MKKTFILLAFALAACGPTASNDEPRVTAPNEMANGMEQDDPRENMSVPYKCATGSYVSVQFNMAMDKIAINENGSEPSVLLLTATDSGKLFENADWSVHFKGENAAVTDKKTGNTRTCTPPFSKDAPPMNFGN